MYLKVVYNMVLSNKHENTCMHVGVRNARGLRKTNTSAITVIIFNNSLLNLSYKNINSRA